MDFLGNMFNMDGSQNAYDHVYGGAHHKSSFTHELIAGAAGFAAMKAYEDHCRRTGEQVSHPLMKEMLAAFAAAEVDKLFETHGLDFLDRERAKRQAIQQAHQLAEQQYGAGGVFNANQYGQGGGFNSNQYGQGGGFNPNQYGQGGGFNGPPDSYGNYPQQGGYGMNQFNDPNYQQQGGFGMNQFNDPNYQQQGGEHHRHHHHNY